MSASASIPRPTGLKAHEGLELLTWGTPNGHKITIFLEELRETYGTDYVWQGVDISQNIQKEEWFTKLGPNGRIPVLIDHDNGGFSIMEGLAILNYLARHYDTDHVFSFQDANDIADAEQWISWAHGGLGPMQGQANHFLRYAKEKIPYAIQRYVGETERLYGVLDTRLQDRDYLVGNGRGKYSIADIATYGWVNFAYYSGVDLSFFKNLHAWWERVEARPTVRKGTQIPRLNQSIVRAYQDRLEKEEEFKKKETEAKELVARAKEQYGYEYKAV